MLDGNLPIYVTRKNAHGMTGTLSVSPLIAAVLLALFVLNLVGWGTFSLYVLVRSIINQF